MWVISTFFLCFLIPISINDIIGVPIMLPSMLNILPSITIFTLIVLAFTTKGLVFFGGIAGGMGIALIARRIFN